MSLADTVAHLSPERWEKANRLLVRKALAEFAHEKLITPMKDEDAYVVHSDDGLTDYRFTAVRRALDHWQIDADSIIRTRNSTELRVAALDFIIELRQALCLSDEVLPAYLEEISSTLSGTCYKLSKPRVSSAELIDSGFQAIEAGMTEGHPAFVANNGRLGFGIRDYLSYAPEAASPVRLVWLAAHRSRAAFSAGAGIEYQSFIQQELGEEIVERFHYRLADLGLDPANYLLVPVHPWQWWNKLTVTFAAEIARWHLVYLGEGDDEYLAQQSVRTFFNVSHPQKHYVKTSLSVINMGFMRGLSAAYMEATPAINDWLAQVIEDDPVLKATGLSIIRERAAVGYRHLEYEKATDRHSPYRKMLAALWRESPVPSLRDGESLATMASLLHVDHEGHGVAAALIKQSGLAPAEWLRSYLRAYYTPLLHSFYAHDLVFMPHGENVILVLKDSVVRRVIYKDIAEEIAILNPDTMLPPEITRIRVKVPDKMKLLSIFIDVFDCFFRFLAANLAAEAVLDEDSFWRTVAEVTHEYQKGSPGLFEKFRQYDIFASEFALSCVNRLQLRNNKQMVDLANPAATLQFSGNLKNPIARL